MTDELESDRDGNRAVRRSKVERVIETRDLTGMDDELVQRWTREGSKRSSLRDLAQYFNKQVLDSALEGTDIQPLDGEVNNLYRLLRGDEVSSGTRIKAERRLEREGIDVKELTDDFVSHQAIHTYFREYRDITSPKETHGSTIENSKESIQRLQNRTRSVVQNTLSSLLNSDRIDLAGFRVHVTIRVTCEECLTQHEVADLFETGGCECRQNS